MSFGFSIGDLATLIALTKKTYDSWQQAPKEYADVVRTLRESKTLLCHVQNRFDALTTTGAGNDAAKQKEIESLLRGCQSAISELRAVVKRRRKLGHWDRIRLGGSSGHVHECRSRLARHINILTPFLFSLELESIGRDIGSLPAVLDRLPQAVTNALPAALGKMIDERIEDSRTARGSVMTTYGDDDDKQAYRELRRNLRFFGIKDSVVRQQRAKLVEFIKTLTQEDHHTTENESDHSDHIPEEQVVSVPSPSLVPLVFEAAEEVKIASEPLPGTRVRRQYQAYVETEDEDDPTDSTVAKPSNDDAERRPEHAKEPAVRSDEVNAADETKHGAKDTPDVPQGADKIPGVPGNAAAPKGRRKYQAYVETEDEDDILESATRVLSDSSVPAVSEMCIEEIQTDHVIGAREDHLPSPKLDDGAPPPTHANADCRPKARKETSTRGAFEGPKRAKLHTKADRSSKRTSSPAFAVCGDLEYQQCLDSSSESEDFNSVAAHGSRNSYCSSCDQELTSPDEASWEQHSVDGNYSSDFEWHSEADDDTSKIAHSGGTDGEEDYSTRFSKGSSARRPDNSQKRANRKAEPNPFSPPPSSNVRTAPPPRNPPQRMIEYKPLNASEEGLLTIQLHMPTGYSIHVVSGWIAQFYNPCVPNTWRQYFPTLPPNNGHRSNCVHGFPGAPLLGRTARCKCQVLYWTPDLQYWNPTFVDGLRDWVQGQDMSSAEGRESVN